MLFTISIFIMILLDWKIVASKIKDELKNYISEKKLDNKYVAIFLLWDDKPSEVYVSMKKKFWNDIWIDVKVFGNKKFINKNNSDIINSILKLNLLDINELMKSIELLNNDLECIWIVVQLPLPQTLQTYKSQILATINFSKDIDWLGGSLMWLSTIDYIDFLPATPASVINLLDYYWLANFEWKTVTVIWQSNLVGKPLVMEIIKKYWEVFSFNHRWSIELIKDCCKKSDYIISATWKINMIDDTYLRDDDSQILVDVWYWILDWKAVWDINFESVKNKVKAISPVPWWVWPLTVACLFNNIKIINEQIDKIKKFL